MSDTPVLELLVARAGELFSLPRVAFQVLELTQHPRVDAAALKKCLENDPALTGKLLRVVNSSLFGLQREVSDLGQALALLGVKPLKLLVLGFSLPPNLFLGLESELLAWYWQRTLTKAVAARELAARWGLKRGDEPFIAALLQDLGFLVLVQEVGRPFANFWRRVRDSQVDLLAMERQALGFDHTELTQRLLQQWRLPESLISCIAVGFPGDRAPDAALVADPNRRGGELQVSELRKILELAEDVSRVLIDGQPDALQRLGDRLDPRGSDAESLARLMAPLEEQVTQLAEVLSLDLPSGRKYDELLLEAYARLAEVATEAAAEMLVGQVGAPERQVAASREVSELSQWAAAWRRVDPPSSKPPAASEPPRLAEASNPTRENDGGDRGRPDESAAGLPFDSERLADPREKAGAAGNRNGVGTLNGGSDLGGSDRSSASEGAAISATAAPLSLAPKPTTVLAELATEAMPRDADRASARRGATGASGDDPAFWGALSAAAAECRLNREPLSLLLLELYDFGDLVFQVGAQRCAEAWQLLLAAAERSVGPGRSCQELGDGRLAAILVDCDRVGANRIGNDLLTAWRRLLTHRLGKAAASIRISGGAAAVLLPPPAFDVQRLIDAADRCQFAARSVQGDCLKSIEVW